MPKISVIVPVYNVEKYLRQCIDSVLLQSYVDFELLLINDGSKDSSGKICDEYAARDSRVRVLHKENGGVSSARNLGLDNAQGEWIMFLDADDFWADNNILKKLIDVAERDNLDIVRGEYFSLIENTGATEYRDFFNKVGLVGEVLNTSEFILNAVNGEFFLYLCLVGKEKIGNLRFQVGQVFLEDMRFLVQLLSKELNCGYISDAFYAYRKLSTSASNNVSIKKLADSFEMCNFFWEAANVVDDFNFKNYCKREAIMIYYSTLSTVSVKPYWQIRDEIISTLNLNHLHKLTLQRKREIAISKKYLPFICLPPRFSLIILHFKNVLAIKFVEFRRKYNI